MGVKEWGGKGMGKEGKGRGGRERERKGEGQRNKNTPSDRSGYGPDCLCGSCASCLLLSLLTTNEKQLTSQLRCHIQFHCRPNRNW